VACCAFRDGDDVVVFDEFVFSLWNYCSFDHSSLCKLTFAMMDVNHSQRIERSDLAAFMAMIYGRASAKDTATRVKRTMELFGKSEKDEFGVNLAEFMAFYKRGGLDWLLFPAFHIQQILRKRTLGDLFWAAKSEGRIKEAERDRNVYEVLDRMKIRRLDY
jgi:hypothetical protein